MKPTINLKDIEIDMCVDALENILWSDKIWDDRAQKIIRKLNDAKGQANEPAQI